MSDLVLQLSALSMVCGAILTLFPEGGCKHITQVLCCAVLVSSILSPIIGFDFNSFALESAKLHELEASFSQEALESQSRLNRLVIQQHYCEYILDKASELGLEALEVELVTQWHEDGLWVPYSLDIFGCWDNSQGLPVRRGRYTVHQW